MCDLPIDLKFHQIIDIRKVYDVDSAKTFWVVDYIEGPDLLPQSIPFLDLSEASENEVLAAYLDVLMGDECLKNPQDISEILSTFFSDHWELIPEVAF